MSHSVKSVPVFRCNHAYLGRGGGHNRTVARGGTVGNALQVRPPGVLPRGREVPLAGHKGNCKMRGKRADPDALMHRKVALTRPRLLKLAKSVLESYFWHVLTRIP